MAALERDPQDVDWGPPVLPRRRSGAREESRRRRDELFLAQHAQHLRAEDVAMGYREETARYFGTGEFAGTGEERLILVRDLEREERAERELARDQEAPHGSEVAFRSCTAGPGGARCSECRSYQRARVARNRAARLASGVCTQSLSCYDAGCRLPTCRALHAAAWVRYRARRSS